MTRATNACSRLFQPTKVNILKFHRALYLQIVMGYVEVLNKYIYLDVYKYIYICIGYMYYVFKYIYIYINVYIVFQINR